MMEEEDSHHPPKRRTIQWDEPTIAEHDKERGTRMKINEPKTPYHRPQFGSVLEGLSESDPRLQRLLEDNWQLVGDDHRNEATNASQLVSYVEGNMNDISHVSVPLPADLEKNQLKSQPEQVDIAPNSPPVRPIDIAAACGKSLNYDSDDSYSKTQAEEKKVMFAAQRRGHYGGEFNRMKLLLAQMPSDDEDDE